MKTLLLSMAVGLVAGLLDILPMIARKLEKRAIASAFVHYFLVSIVIINMPLPGIAWWLNGPIIAAAFAVPVIIMVSKDDPKAVPAISIMALVLGFLISLAGHYLVLS